MAAAAPPASLTRGRSVTLCADDYGIAPGVSRAIRELIQRGRLSATSCMTTTAFWPSEAGPLIDGAGRAQAGLHLTLTDGSPLGKMPGLAPGGRLPAVGEIIRKAMRKQLDQAEIEDEIERQVDAFTAAAGRRPAFLDGHHHVHQLPTVREALLAVWNRRFSGSDVWIRCGWESPIRILRRGIDPGKAMAIGAFGLGLRRLAKRFNVPMNSGFTGIYDFARPKPMDSLMARFLSASIDRTLIMCHPGLVDAALERADGLLARREEEFRYLMSADFARLLARHKIALDTANPILD